MPRVGDEFEPLTPTDQLITRLSCIPPLHGLFEGIEQALPDHLFHAGFTRLVGYEPTWMPLGENLRVSSGLWSTRLGIVCICPSGFTGTGPVRLLSTLYTDTAQRIRIGARGLTNAAVFMFALDTGAPFSLVAATGGTALGSAAEPYFQGVIQNNTYYFTDRAGALRKFIYAPTDGGTQVRSVALPTAPSVAPVILPRTYRLHDPFTVSPANSDTYTDWTNDSPADFPLQNYSPANAGGHAPVLVPPGGGNATRLHILAGSAVGKTITRNMISLRTDQKDLSSHTLAFWLRLDKGQTSVQFQFGINAATDYSVPLLTSGGSEWRPFFIRVADLPSLNFERFQCLDTFNGDGPYISPLYLPGRLEGQYRWIYTYYDSVNLRESSPSPISGGGTPTDFSTVGVNEQTATIGAFRKSAAMKFTLSGDPLINKIRIYRNGGTPELTVDSRGVNVWLQVGEVLNLGTTLRTAATAGDVILNVTANTIGVYQSLLVLEPGTAKEEYVRVLAAGGVGPNFTITPEQPLLYSHNNGSTLNTAFLDNVANEMIDVTAAIDIERNDPPAAAKFIARSPEGRLWLFNYLGKPTGIAVSNRATPLRPLDYEVYPDAVDPLTRRSLLQGWRFELGGDQNDEEIVWGGLYRDQMTVLTRHNLYVITAHSQIDWGPLAVRKMLSVGCIAKDSVKEIDGVLFWVSDGPRIMRWDGSGEPEDVSRLRANVRLQAANPIDATNWPTAKPWDNWFAGVHSKADGIYYMLYFQPSGDTGITQRLDLNVTPRADMHLNGNGLFEPVTYYASPNLLANPIVFVKRVWQAMTVWDSGKDLSQLMQVDDAGVIYQCEIGNTDDGTPIKVTVQTKKYPVQQIALQQQSFLRFLATVNPSYESASLTVTTGGSDYGTVTHTYPFVAAGSGDKEVKVRLDRDLLGRWVQAQLDWYSDSALSIRDLELWHVIQRNARTTL